MDEPALEGVEELWRCNGAHDGGISVRSWGAGISPFRLQNIPVRAWVARGRQDGVEELSYRRRELGDAT